MSWLGELTDFGPAPLAVDIYWESYPGKKAHVWRLWQQTGWMQVSRVSLETPVSSHEEIITYFCNDMGQLMPAWLGNRLFDMRSSIPSYMHHEPPEELEDHADALYWDFLGRCDRKNLAELEQNEDMLFQDISRVEQTALEGVTEVDRFITGLRREKRHPECNDARKAEIDARIANVEKYKPQLLATIPGEIRTLRKAHEAFEEDVFESVTHHGRVETLYTVRWTMRSRHQPPPVNVSFWTEERFMGNLNVGSKWKEGMRAGHRIDVTPDKPDQISTKKDVKAALIKMKEQAHNAETDADVRKPAPRKRGRPPGSKNRQRDIKPSANPPRFAGVNEGLKKSSRRKAKREARLQLSLVLEKHGTLAEMPYVRAALKGKTGTELKTALIHLAKHAFMTTDDAVYLFKVLSALKTKLKPKNSE